MPYSVLPRAGWGGQGAGRGHGQECPGDPAWHRAPCSAVTLTEGDEAEGGLAKVAVGQRLARPCLAGGRR